MASLEGSGKGGTQNFATVLEKVGFSWFFEDFYIFQKWWQNMIRDLALARQKPCSLHHLPHQVIWIPPESCWLGRKDVRMAPESPRTCMDRFLHAKYEFRNLAYHGVGRSEIFAFFAGFSKSVAKHPRKTATFSSFWPFRGGNPSDRPDFFKKKFAAQSLQRSTYFAN